MKKLYIKQKVFKITDHYEVYDERQNPVYQVDQDFTFIGNRVHVRKLDSDIGFKVEKQIFTLLPRYNVDFWDGKSYVIKQNFTFFKKELEILSNDYNLRVQGNFWDYIFDVYDGSRLIGKIRKEIIAWGDTFEITVLDEEFEEELLSLLIAIDNIQDRQQRAAHHHH